MGVYKIIGPRWASEKKIVQSVDDAANIKAVAPTLCKKLGLDSLRGYKILACEGMTQKPKKEINLDTSPKSQQVVNMGYLYICLESEVPAGVTLLDGGSSSVPAAEASSSVTPATATSGSTQNAEAEKKKQEEEAAAAAKKKKEEEEAAAALKKKQEEEAAAALKKKQEQEAAAALKKKQEEEAAVAAAKKKREEEQAAAKKKREEEQAAAKKKREEEEAAAAKSAADLKKFREEAAAAEEAERKKKNAEADAAAKKKAQEEEEERQRVVAAVAAEVERRRKEEEIKKQIEEKQKKQQQAITNANTSTGSAVQSSQFASSSSGAKPPIPAKSNNNTPHNNSATQQKQQQHHHQAAAAAAAVDPVTPERDANAAAAAAAGGEGKGAGGEGKGRYGFAWELINARQKAKHQKAAADQNDDPLLDESNQSYSRGLALARSRLAALPYRPGSHHQSLSAVEQIDQIAVAAELSLAMHLRKEEELRAASPPRTTIIQAAEDEELKKMMEEVAEKTAASSRRDFEAVMAEREKEQQILKQKEELEKQLAELKKQQEEREKKEKDEKAERERREKEARAAAKQPKPATHEDLVVLQNRIDELLKSNQELAKKVEGQSPHRNYHQDEEEDGGDEYNNDDDNVDSNNYNNNNNNNQQHQQQQQSQHPMTPPPRQQQQVVTPLPKQQQQQQQQQQQVSVSPAVPILMNSPSMMGATATGGSTTKNPGNSKVDANTAAAAAAGGVEGGQQQKPLLTTQQLEENSKNNNNNNNASMINSQPQTPDHLNVTPADTTMMLDNTTGTISSTSPIVNTHHHHHQNQNPNSKNNNNNNSVAAEIEQQMQQMQLQDQQQQQQQQQPPRRGQSLNQRRGLRQMRSGSQNDPSNNNSNSNNNNNSTVGRQQQTNAMQPTSFSAPSQKGSRIPYYQQQQEQTQGRPSQGNNNTSSSSSVTAAAGGQGSSSSNYSPSPAVAQNQRQQQYQNQNNNLMNMSLQSQNPSNFNHQSNPMVPVTMNDAMQQLSEGAHAFLVNDRRSIRDWITRACSSTGGGGGNNNNTSSSSSFTAPGTSSALSQTIVPDTALTLVANSPPFIRSIVVPLMIDQISAAIDRRGNVVGPDGNKQKFSQLLSAVAGLGRVASDCYPILRSWAKQGAENADKALLALALRSTGGMLAVTDAIATLKSEGASAPARNIAAYSLGLLATDGTAAPPFKRTRVFIYDSPILEEAAIAASRAGANGVLSLVQLERPSSTVDASSGHRATAHHKLPRYGRTCILLARQAALRRCLEFLSSPQSLPDYNEEDEDAIDSANWMVPPAAPRILIEQHVEAAKQLAESLQMTSLGLPSWLDPSSSSASSVLSRQVGLDIGATFDGTYTQLEQESSSQLVDPQLLPIREVGLHLVSLLETDDSDASGSVQELALLALPKLPKVARAMLLEPLLRLMPNLIHSHGDSHPRVIAAAATALGDSVAVVGSAAHQTLCEDATAVLCNLIAPTSDVAVATAACEALANMAEAIRDETPSSRIFWAWERHHLITADTVASALVALNCTHLISQHVMYCVTAVANHGGERGLLHRCSALVDAVADHITVDHCTTTTANSFVEAFLGALRMLPSETAFCIASVRGLARIGVSPGAVPCDRLDEAVTVAKNAPPLPFWEELETVIESDLYAPPVKTAIVEALVKEGGSAGEVKVTRLMLRHAFPWIRAACTRALKFSSGTPIVALLLAANDTDATVRECALETIESLTQERCAEALQTVQKSRVKAVAQCCRDYLQFGAAETVSMVLQICEAVLETEPRM